MAKLTDAIFKDGIHEETEIETAEEMKFFLEAVKRNLDIFTALIEYHHMNTDNSFTQLASIENKLSLFTFKPFDVSQYDASSNGIGECVITQIGDILSGQCHINFLNSPKPCLVNACREHLRKFPESGEIFAINCGDQGLLRAVRSDLIFKVRHRFTFITYSIRR